MAAWEWLAAVPAYACPSMPGASDTSYAVALPCLSRTPANKAPKSSLSLIAGETTTAEGSFVGVGERENLDALEAKGPAVVLGLA
jgi:hypothetical protein